MTEVIYLPLKNAGGTIQGYARIADGICRLRLKRPVRGQAVVMGEDGTWCGAADGEIAVRGRLSAVAVLEEGRLLCCGSPAAYRVQFSELARQLERPAENIKKESPQRAASAPPCEDPPPQPEALPPPMPKLPQAICEEQDAPLETAPRCTVRIPRHAIRKRSIHAASRLTEAPEASQKLPEAEEVFLPWDNTAAFAKETRDTPLLHLFDDAAPSLADSTADSESFAALLRRAELVFESIESPHPPLITGSADGTAAPRVLSAGGTSRLSAGWEQEVDRLLSAQAEPAAIPIENPFPHVFPNAVFRRIGPVGNDERLEGEWVSGGERLHISAVAGSYSPQPPAQLSGYTRFIRTRQGSYWVRVTGC